MKITFNEVMLWAWKNMQKRSYRRSRQTMRDTQKQKDILQTIFENDAIGDLSAEFISTELSVSPASLSRFAKKSGYQGYREFVYEYRNSYVEKTTVEQEESRLVLDTYQSLLNKVYNLLDEAQIKRIVEKLRTAKRVYVCGRGSSGLAAEEMATRFRWIGIDMVALRDNENIKMQSVFLNPQNLVIGLSLSGTKSEVLYMLARGCRQGADTILITEKTESHTKTFAGK